MAAKPPPTTENSGSGRPLLLASSSAYRRELLARLRLPFAWAAPDIDESPRPAEPAPALVRRLSVAKARALAAPAERRLIIAGDQVALLGDTVLGKSGHREAAIEQLLAASGRTLRYLTALCVLDGVSGAYEVDVVPTEVRFRPLTRALVEAYVDAVEPYDCAGSLRIESLGIVLCERVVGADPTALLGLPLIRLVDMLGRAGLRLLQVPGRDTAMDEVGQHPGATAFEQAGQ